MLRLEVEHWESLRHTQDHNGDYTEGMGVVGRVGENDKNGKGKRGGELVVREQQQHDNNISYSSFSAFCLNSVWHSSRRPMMGMLRAVKHLHCASRVRALTAPSILYWYLYLQACLR
jgi:hypothetical protein